jgi:hypothetical protein
MLKSLDMQGCNTAVPHRDQGKMLDPREVSVFRSVVARGNYLFQDRSVIRYAVKELLPEDAQTDEFGLGRLQASLQVPCGCVGGRAIGGSGGFGCLDNCVC